MAGFRLLYNNWGHTCILTVSNHIKWLDLGCKYGKKKNPKEQNHKNFEHQKELNELQKTWRRKTDDGPMKNKPTLYNEKSHILLLAASEHIHKEITKAANILFKVAREGEPQSLPLLPVCYQCPEPAKDHRSVGDHLKSSTKEFQPLQAESQLHQEPNWNASRQIHVALGISWS